jgi:hypothetical protein
LKPSSHLRFLLLLVALALGLALAACAADRRVVASYEETCPPCGMRWRVDILRSDGRPAAARVRVENTGERGNLTLLFTQVGGAYLDSTQAEGWARVYAEARANRSVPDQFVRVGSSNTRWRASNDTRLPVTIAPGSSWTGSFELAQGRLPSDPSALILTFGPVRYEKVSEGQPQQESWITWDATRPFIGLRGQTPARPFP